MDNQILQKIQGFIDKNDKIGIAVGKNPTVDTMAAALTLSLGLQEYGKRPTVVSASQPLVEHSSLVGIDKVRNGFEGDGGDLVVSFPYREGEIEKVSYTIDGGYLNIVVKAGEQGLTFSESDVRFRRGGGAPSLLFIVGTSRLSDLGTIFDPEALKNTTIVNIDNHADNQGYGDVQLIQPTTASVSEIVHDLVYSLGTQITVDMAQNLFLGINDGTNNMQDPRVSYTTFEIIANLMKQGAARPQAPMPQQQPPVPPSPTGARFGSQSPFGQRPQMPGAQAGTQRFGGQQSPFPRPQQGMPRPQQGMPRPQMPRPSMMPRPQMPPRQDPYAQPPMPQPQAPSATGSQFTGQQNPPMPQPDMSQQQDQGQPDMTGRQDQGQQQRRDNQRRDQGQDRKPPSDWLQPKVYKGSSNV